MNDVDDQRHGPRILIVTDDAATQQDFARIFARPKSPASLSSLDFAKTGESAVACVMQSISVNTPYTLAFVDIEIESPGCDDVGLRTVHELWNIDPQIQIALLRAGSACEDLEGSFGGSDDSASVLVARKPLEAFEVRQIANVLTRKWSLVREKDCAMKERQRDANKFQSLGHVASSVAHDINNPLGYVIANLDYCKNAIVEHGSSGSAINVASVCEALDDASMGAEKIRRLVLESPLFSPHPQEPVSAVVDRTTGMHSVVRMVVGQRRRTGTWCR